MDISVLPLHKYPEYLQTCCNLINTEWTRSDTARLRSLESSCDQLPVSLILVKNKKLLGHLKLTAIPSIPDACFVETVVIDKQERGKGYGTILMKNAEKYCKEWLNLNGIYLSTKGQETFYSKLGYTECLPISIYGTATPSNNISNNINFCRKGNLNADDKIPAAPPLPVKNMFVKNSKTFMKKEL